MAIKKKAASAKPSVKKASGKRPAAKKRTEKPSVAEQWSVKHRPSGLDEFILSDDNKALVEAVLEGRKRPKTIIISGASGTGKTSLAYVIADALTKGSRSDFHDLNCVTNGSIEEVRGLIHESSYLPSKKGAKRVILLDEAQALVGKSASAVLKPLENPDPHTVWILATDQPGKVLPTVRSRGMHIQLPTPVRSDLARHLLGIAKTENALPPKWAVPDLKEMAQAVATAADGNIRTGLNLMEAVLTKVVALKLKSWKAADEHGVLPATDHKVPHAVEELFHGVNETLKTGMSHFGVLASFRGLNGLEIIEGITKVSSAALLGTIKPLAPLSVHAKSLTLAQAARDAILTIPANSGYHEAMARALSVGGDLLARAVEIVADARRRDK